jgi:hypothetical protein
MSKDAEHLESWYRRLIAVYPAGHRAVFAEDMLSVLMAGSAADQSRPDIRTGFDVLKGAMSAWVLRFRSAGRLWQRTDAAAAVTVLALLILSTQSFLAAGIVLDDDWGSSYGRRGEVGLWLPLLIWLPVTVAAFAGLRRSAAWVACGFGIFLPLINSVVMIWWVPGFLGGVHSQLWFAVGLLAAWGLSAERGPAPGFRILGRGITSLAALGVVIIGVLVMPLPAVLGRLDSLLNSAGLPLLILAITLLAMACVRAVAELGSAQARITAAGITALVLLCGLYGWRDGAGRQYDGWIEELDLALPLLLGITALVAAWSLLNGADAWRGVTTAIRLRTR